MYLTEQRYSSESGAVAPQVQSFGGAVAPRVRFFGGALAPRVQLDSRSESMDLGSEQSIRCANGTALAERVLHQKTTLADQTTAV